MIAWLGLLGLLVLLGLVGLLGLLDSLSRSQWNVAVNRVMVRVVRVLNSKYSTASCVSQINMVYQCALWCSWTTHNLSETETRH